MNRTRRTFRMTCGVLACLLPLLVGCQSVHSRAQSVCTRVWSHLRHEEPKTEAEEAVVLVGGDVHQPGPITIPRRGLTLSEAVALAGGPRLEIVPMGIAEGSTSAREKLLTLKGSTERTRDAAEKLATDCTPKNLGLFGAANSERQTLQLELASQLMAQLPGERTITLSERLSDADASLNEEVNKLLKKKEAVAGEGGCTEEELAPVKEALAAYEPLLNTIESHIDSGTARTLLRPPNPERETLLVALQRPQESRQVTYHFLHEAIVAGPAGTIPLQDGDFVRVVPVSGTTLRNPRPRMGDAFTVRGLVGRPGQRALSETPTLDALFGERITPGLDASQMSIVLTRATADGLGRDVFVLPYAEAGKPPFDTVETVAVDVYEVVPTLRAPLILETVVGSVVGQVVAERIERRRPELDDFRQPLLSLQKGHESLQRATQRSLQQIMSGQPRCATFVEESP